MRHLILLLFTFTSFCLARDLRRSYSIAAARNIHQAALSLPPIDSDPLASVAPLFGHSASGRTFAMPAVPQSQENIGSGLQPNYEVNRPTRILPSENVKSCTITLATHSFAHSYGQPLAMKYSPSLLPAHCNDPTKWVFIELTLSGNVSGRQFDRLGSVQLDSIEVLRTDNPEPTQAGVQWSFTKEMNVYFDLFRSERSLIFDFPNIVNDVYTGVLNTTLSFTAYVPASSACKLPPLSASYPKIIALSKGNFTENSFFNVGENGEDSGSTQVKLPINAVSALVEIYASGTAADEFSYTNIPDFLYEKIGAEQAAKAGLNARGPLREIQILVDGRLAGVAQPFPVVFTGGISPYFWRPQVAFGAYNQPTYYVDISPFLGSLTDEAEHQIQLKVVSAEKNQTVLSWFISGNIQVQLDSTSERTTGSITSYDAPLAGDFNVTGVVGPNFNATGNLQFQVEGPRSISIEATLKPGSGSQPFTVRWQQNYYYSNTNQLNNTTSNTVQHASGTSQSFHSSEITPFFSQDFSYPFEISSIGYHYTINHGYDETLAFSLPFLFKQPPSQQTSMTQKGKASMILDQGRLVSGSGETSEEYEYSDTNGFTFTQTNKASNGTVIENNTGGTLSSKATKVYKD